MYYVNAKECNLSPYIGLDANRRLIASIDSLLTKEVVGLFYSDPLGAIYILTGGPTRNYNDGRFLYLNKNKINMNSHSEYKIIDVKDSIYLLRKRYPETEN